MTFLQFVLRSLRHSVGLHLATGAGVAMASAIICGALLVGDSVRESLRRLTNERLGSIDFALLAPRFVRAELADEVAASEAHDNQQLVVGACFEKESSA